jgi:hypothetical protein
MLVNGSFCLLAPALELRHQRGQKLLFWRSLDDMTHEVQSIKLYVGDHDGIPGGVGGERRND